MRKSEMYILLGIAVGIGLIVAERQTRPLDRLTRELNEILAKGVYIPDKRKYNNRER